MADKPEISIEVYQQDWIPGFAAFRNNGQLKKDGRAHVILNMGSIMCAVASGDIDRQDVPYMVAESLMHEVIHVLESWANVEFSEEKVESLIEKYQQKYKRGD